MIKHRNIALISTFYGENLGGAEKSIGLLADLLRQKGFNVKVFSTRAYKLSQKNIIQIPYTRYIPNKFLLLGNSLLDWYLYWCLARVIKKDSGYDFLHSQDFFILPATVKIGYRIKLPIIAQVREVIDKKVYRGNYSMIVTYLGNLLLKSRLKTWRKSLSQCSRVIAISEFIKKNLVLNGLQSKNISTVYNFLKPETISKIQKGKRVAKTTKIIYFMPGRIEVEKGHQLLINTLKKLPEKNYQVRLAGQGPYEPELKKIIKKYNLERNVKFLGQLKERAMQKEYNNCHYVLQLGKVPEGFGRTILEALLHSKKVIALDVGAKKELLTNKGRGFLINSNKASEELLSILQLTMEEKQYPKVSTEELKKIKEQFSGDRVYKKLLEIYNSYASTKV